MAVFFVDLFAIIEGWWNSLIENLPTIVVALVVLLLASWLARLLRNAASRALMLRNTDMEIIVLVSRLVQWSVIGLGILLAASQAGFDITAFLTGLGILGFTLGFALQDVSKNFVAGMLLLILQPFDLGDTIEVSGIQGKVIEVDLRATLLRTLDGLHVSIPNGDVFTKPITNYTRSVQRRLQHTVGIAYDSDLEVVRQKALEAIAGIPGVLDEPAPEFRFEAFGDYTINFTIFYWFDGNHTNLSAALDAGITRINTAFAEAGIVVPGPEQTIKLKHIDGDTN